MIYNNTTYFVARSYLRFIEEGRYSTSSDYVRDLFSRDQDRKQKIETMQQAITLGLESKDVKDFDINTFTKRMLKESQNNTL